MRIFEKLFRPSKLESLGDGLNAVKAKMDVVGKNLAAEKGNRLYSTSSGNLVSITSDSWQLLIIKVLGPLEKLKDYTGKISRLVRNYGVYVKNGGGKVRQYADTVIGRFSRWGEKTASCYNLPALTQEGMLGSVGVTFYRNPNRIEENLVRELIHLQDR